MPHRVLVADDEELERRALRAILGAEGMPQAEILEAANGREALELAQDGRLDVAFLDIRMPGIDGIEAARLLHEKHPALPIIFLTAHDTFDYARFALRLRVEDFLLKPASAEEVKAAYLKALAATDAASQRAESSRVATAKLESALEFLGTEIRSALSAGRVDSAACDRYTSLLGLDSWIAAVVEVRCRAQRGRSDEIAKLIESVLLSRGILAFSGPSPEGALCAVMVRGEPTREEEVLRPVLDELTERCRAELGAPILIGVAIACPRATAEDLSRAARRAAALASSGRPIVVLSLSVAAKESAGPADHLVPASEDLESSRSGRRTVSRALSLLDDRLSEDLSLELVASDLGVSPSHLSRLLVKHAGMGFADCLARLRVERAKSFLASGTISVKEAAAVVGFRDPAYFARVFRRFEGVSPAEYRAGAAAKPDSATKKVDK